VKAPFIPNIKSEIDVSNFDPEFTECDVESFSEASMKSHEDGKPYYGNLWDIVGFSFDKSKEDEMEIENEGNDGEFEIRIEEDRKEMVD
jgi:hypothetical protein